MKRIISILLVLVLIFSLAGCGGSGAGTSSTEAQKAICLNGVELEDWSIVVPEGCDKLTYHAAEIFFQYLFITKDITLRLITDKSPEADYEILVGNTNREASKEAANTELSEGEYLLKADDNKIVVLGDTYLIGAGLSELINESFAKNKSATVSADAQPKTFTFGKADSVIVMIADGMGPNHIEAAKKEGLKVFYPETLPAITDMNTANATGGVTDSAAAATAMATGKRTSNKRLGQDSAGNRLTNLTELASSKGAKVAIATTDGLYGATPSGFAVHTDNRSNTDDIAQQFNNLLTLGKLQYAQGELGNSLCEISAMYCRDISMDGSKFFMMIEEAYTDLCSHSNDYNGMVAAVNRFNDTTAYFIEYAVLFPRIALIITSDHETGGLINNNGNFEFTTTNHSGTNVKFFALGSGTERFRQKRLIENTEVASFSAEVFGEKHFGK